MKAWLIMKLTRSLRRYRCVATLIALLAWNHGDDSHAQLSGADVAKLLQRTIGESVTQVERSVVSIARVKRMRPAAEPPPRVGLQLRDPFDTSDDPRSVDFTPDDFGAGVVIKAKLADRTSQPVILTNYHVVRGGPITLDSTSPSRIFVRFATRHTIEATIIAADPRSDLAVLKIDLKQLEDQATNLPAVLIDKPHAIRKAQFVMTLGNPYAIAKDGQASVSWGMISNIARRPAPLGDPFDEDVRMRETVHHLGSLLQVDTRLNLGTSGGALIDVDGNLIGVTTSLAAMNGYEKSVGYAIPLDAPMIRIVKELVQGHEVEYGFLGIAPVNVQTRHVPGHPVAVKVQQVYVDSPAHVYGIEHDDIVTHVNGTPIYDKSGLMRLVALTPPGGYARLTVWRNNHQLSAPLTVKLGKWPVSDADGIIATSPQSYYRLRRGIAVDYSTGRREYTPRPFRFHKAVAVRAIDKASPLMTELEIGQFITAINGKRVTSPSQFHEALDAAKGEVAKLTVIEGREYRTVTLPAE